MHDPMDFWNVVIGAKVGLRPCDMADLSIEQYDQIMKAGKRPSEFAVMGKPDG